MGSSGMLGMYLDLYDPWLSTKLFLSFEVGLNSTVSLCVVWFLQQGIVFPSLPP